MDTAQAAQQAITIAERLLNPEQVLAAVPDRPAASLQSLAGTALLHARLARVDPSFETAARTHWAAAATGPRPRAAHPGVFAAPGGMAASLILGETYLADPEPQLPDIRHAVKWLTAQAVNKATARHERLRRDPMTPPTWALYDVITGLAGTGRILLAALADGHRDAEPGLLAALTTLTTMINTPRSETRPGWWLPADGHTTTGGVSLSGVAETGMAHGIAGPLTLLATSASAGWTIGGQTTAIRTATSWLLTWQSPDTTTWPPHITGTELDNQQPAPNPAPGRRDAWCYGTPGIGRALTAAGRALNDPRPAQAGTTAITALADQAADRWDTEGPALCHGTAGILQGAASHPATADLAATALTTAIDPRHTFAVQNLHHHTATDDPGLLTGAAGIALALADHGGLPTPKNPTRWDAALLLS
ncbi:Lanthionine synthetase C-like protein [Sinosporangium album]|uniref:Lanthionine synthetase C-like protein n=1 Tax=Sinosporangium album TaxID=504805 RepID=A0A1G7YTZ9_9ACTN|nr:lanthionine synthetase LanC family protein [Sinosporangium album]SDG99857.1 Lanthionine synthetase C-like protein [Sinosporangium album]